MGVCASQELMTTTEAVLGGTDFAEKIPALLLADLERDHAGEAGAVMIYRGVLSVSRNQETGTLPSVFGPRAVYATIALAEEEFERGFVSP